MPDPQPYAQRVLPDPRLATTQAPVPPDALLPPQQATQPVLGLPGPLRVPGDVYDTPSPLLTPLPPPSPWDLANAALADRKAELNPWSGVKRAVKGAAVLGRALPQDDDFLQRGGLPSPGPTPSLRETAAGASDVIRGTMEASTPLLPAAIAAAPVRAAAMLGTGSLVATAVQHLGQQLQIPEEYVRLAVDALGLTAGIAAGKVVDSPELQASILDKVHEFTVSDEGAVQLPKPKVKVVKLTREAAAQHLASVAEDHLNRAPVERVGDRLLVSPRILGAQGKNFTPAPQGQILLPTLEAAKGDPEFFARLADEARKSPMLRPSEVRGSDERVVNNYVNRGAENIHALFDMSSPAVYTRGGLWYPGGQGIGDAIAADAGVPNSAGSGVIARLSPGTNWDMNINNGQRIGRWRGVFDKTDQAFTQDHFDQFLQSMLDSADEWVKKEHLTGADEADYRAGIARRIEATRGYIDHPWSALPYQQKAQLLRAHSELNEPQSYAVYAPEGHIAMPEALTKKGKPMNVKWQSYDNLARALLMLDHPSDAAISFLLGEGHKIRSFFNNLSVPTDPRSLTADVHNVAGTNLQPLGGSTPEVKAVTGGMDNAKTGISGTYPLYQAATELAAKDRGLVPNVAQSIPWETTRGLFSPSQRSQKGFRDVARQLWADFQSGRVPLDATQSRLHDLAGGVTPPAWASYPVPSKPKP